MLILKKFHKLFCIRGSLTHFQWHHLLLHWSIAIVPLRPIKPRQAKQEPDKPHKQVVLIIELNYINKQIPILHHTRTLPWCLCDIVVSAIDCICLTLFTIRHANIVITICIPRLTTIASGIRCPPNLTHTQCFYFTYRYTQTQCA